MAAAAEDGDSAFWVGVCSLTRGLASRAFYQRLFRQHTKDYSRTMGGMGSEFFQNRGLIIFFLSFPPLHELLVTRVLCRHESAIDAPMTYRFALRKPKVL